MEVWTLLCVSRDEVLADLQLPVFIRSKCLCCCRVLRIIRAFFVCFTSHNGDR